MSSLLARLAYLYASSRECQKAHYPYHKRVTFSRKLRALLTLIPIAERCAGKHTYRRHRRVSNQSSIREKAEYLTKFTEFENRRAMFRAEDRTRTLTLAARTIDELKSLGYTESSNLWKRVTKVLDGDTERAIVPPLPRE